jgi:hypothetical protein
MKPFLMIRTEDESGISGTGVVAEGVVFQDGTVVIRWQTHHIEHHSTVVWPSIESVLFIHGHKGRTTIHFYDGENHLTFPQVQS